MTTNAWAWLGLTAPDPLIIVLGLFTVGTMASHFLFRGHHTGRAIVRVFFWVLLTIALLDAKITPYESESLQASGLPLVDFVHAVLKIAWWLWAAWFLVALSRATLRFEEQPHEGRLLQDVVSGLIYLAAILAIIIYVFNLPIKGLLATSGVIAVILGLALQSTLGNVFSGIVLNFTRPYRPGDWVNIGDETSGRVIEINWRATHLLTAQRDLAIIPNTTIAKSKIINASAPSGVHGVSIKVEIPPGPSPSIIADLLSRAILNCHLILQTPAPAVSVKAMNTTSIEFQIDFFVTNLATTIRAQNELLNLVYRHLGFSGLDLSTTKGEKLMRAPMLSPAALLGQAVVFATLSADESVALAQKLERRSYRQGDILVEPGSELHSLQLIASGVLACVREGEDPEEEILRLGPGDHFGELGLLTGEACTFRITALTPVVVYALGRDDLSSIIDAHPEVVEALNQDLALRSAAAPPLPVEGRSLIQAHRPWERVFDWLHQRYAQAAWK